MLPGIGGPGLGPNSQVPGNGRVQRRRLMAVRRRFSVGLWLLFKGEGGTD